MNLATSTSTPVGLPSNQQRLSPTPLRLTGPRVLVQLDLPVTQTAGGLSLARQQPPNSGTILALGSPVQVPRPAMFPNASRRYLRRKARETNADLAELEVGMRVAFKPFAGVEVELAASPRDGRKLRLLEVEDVLLKMPMMEEAP